MAETKTCIEIAYYWVNTITPIFLSLFTGGTLYYLIMQNNLNKKSIEISEIHQIENSIVLFKRELNSIIYSPKDEFDNNIYKGGLALNYFANCLESQIIITPINQSFGDLLVSYMILHSKITNLKTSFAFQENKAKLQSSLDEIETIYETSIQTYLEKVIDNVNKVTGSADYIIMQVAYNSFKSEIENIMSK